MGLSEQGVTWRDYGGIFTGSRSLAGRPEVMDYQDERFFEDAAKAPLPNAAWINSGFVKCSNIIHSEILPFSMCTCYIFLYMPTHNCCAGLASWRRNTDAKPVVVRSINQIHPRRE
jgi:hypothetical protein